MKLAHIVPSLAEQHGGPSKSVRALCGALARSGHAVELFTTDPAAPATGTTRHDGAVRVSAFRRDWPERLCPSAGLRAALGRSDAAVVHHHGAWLRTLHLAHRAARGRGAPLVVSPRGMFSDWAWRHHAWRKRLARRFVHPGAFEAVDGWHATSAAEAGEIRTRGFRQPICVAPNGVEAPAPADVADAAAHWRAACPAVVDRRVALFYSRFHPKKRVAELIELWAREAPAEWLLLIVGLPETYSVEELRALAERTGCARRVAIYSGAGRPPPYAAASLLLLPSHNENFGLVVAEAMAHGVPVLVTDTTPWQQINLDGAGWCVAWEHFAATLRLATRETADALSRRGALAREWVLRTCSWERAARDLAEFYTALTPA